MSKKTSIPPPPKHRSPGGRALEKSQFRQQIIKPKKGKGSYQRQTEKRVNEDVPTNSVGGGGVAMFSPIMRFKEWFKKKQTTEVTPPIEKPKPIERNYRLMGVANLNRK